MKNTIEYKEFRGSYYYSVKDNIWYGKINNIKSLIMFESEHEYEMDSLFIDAVDDYLNLLKEYNVPSNYEKIN